MLVWMLLLKYSRRHCIMLNMYLYSICICISNVIVIRVEFEWKVKERKKVNGREGFSCTSSFCSPSCCSLACSLLLASTAFVHSFAARSLAVRCCSLLADDTAFHCHRSRSSFPFVRSCSRGRRVTVGLSLVAI